METLKTKQEEVKLQSHLLNLELKDQWRLLKKDGRIVEKNLKAVTPVIQRATKRILASLRPVGNSLLDSYKRIKSEIGDLYSRKP